MIKIHKKNQINEELELLNWYKKNCRSLPWRTQKNPYFIWVSEVMLQQTTTAAVTPYFEKFIHRFPSIEALAKSSVEDVLEHWAGLGYYSRARNIHKAAKELCNKDFPKTYTELLKLPGFGSYTSRAVSSIAFNEKVGVLDGNVVRVLCRLYGLEIQWWKTFEKNLLQSISDSFNQEFLSSQMNQALMELGATVCIPQKPRCNLCPWVKICVSKKNSNQESLPIKRPKKESEIWVLKSYLAEENKKIALVQNSFAPFLKKQWILPGKAVQKKKKPNVYSFHHSITHHKIFVQLEMISKAQLKSKIKENMKNIKWIQINEIKKYSQSSLIQKSLRLHSSESIQKTF